MLLQDAAALDTLSVSEGDVSPAAVVASLALRGRLALQENSVHEATCLRRVACGWCLPCESGSEGFIDMRWCRISCIVRCLEDSTTNELEEKQEKKPEQEKPPERD
eukprot:257982-Karenia_brevis.AAC.1